MKRLAIMAAVIAALSPSVCASAQPTDLMLNSMTGFSNCVRANVIMAGSGLHGAIKMGLNVQSMLAVQCSGFLQSYVYQCQAAGYPQDACYDDLKLVINDWLKQAGE